MFAMLRSLSAVGWTIPRMPTDHPRISLYLGRAMRAAEGFLAAA
jgi:hypothetical protein